MVNSQLFVYFTIICVYGQPLWFNAYNFELDGFEIQRGYFRSLDTKQDCIDHNDGHCVYSNFINPPNILYIPDESNSFKSSFKLAPDEAVVISGFAPPLAEYVTITPYVSSTSNTKIHASISNYSLHLNSTWFVAIISGNLHTISSIHDWFRDADTSLTTSIHNHYIYDIPIVQSNQQLNIDNNTEYSVIIRHQTTKDKEDQLKLIYSQAPAWLAWHVKVVEFDEAASEIVTQLNQVKQSPTTDEYNIDLFVPQHNRGNQDTFDQDSFSVDNYHSEQCLSSLISCDFDEPNGILFQSPIFNMDHNAKVLVSGINHINTNTAAYSTVNIVNDMDHSVVAQIRLNDIENDLYQYIIMFAGECSGYNERGGREEITYCQEIPGDALRNQVDLRIIERLSTSSVYGIDVTYIQPPYAVIETLTHPPHPHPHHHHHHHHHHRHQNDNEHTKPNIVLIMLDDLGWRDVGFNGAEYPTQHMDDLATNGLILHNWYVHPGCTPTRTALYTGRYAFRSGMASPVGIGQRRYLPPDEDVLQEVLSSNGYTTHLIGKWHVGSSYWNALPLQRGFDSFLGFTSGFVDYYSHQQCWADWSGKPYPKISGDNNLRLLNAFFPEGRCVYDLFDERQLLLNNDYFPYLLSNRVVDIIQSKRDDDDPFYMLFSMGTPHAPVVDPPQHFAVCNQSLETYGEGRYNYCCMVQIADGIIGDVADALKANDLWNNTVMIVTSDNGGLSNRLPGHSILESYGSNSPLRGLKSSPFEGGNRVIGFISGGYIEQYNLNGKRSNKLYHVVDLYETIINGIANLSINFTDRHLDSLNVWDSILHEDVSSPRTEWVWSVNFGYSPTALRMGDWKLVKGAPGPFGLAFFDGYWDVNDMTLAPGQYQKTEYLFNVTDDEIEYYDVQDEQPDVMEDLKERLLEVQQEGFVPSSDQYEKEGLVIAMLNGVALPFLDLTQDIKIET